MRTALPRPSRRPLAVALWRVRVEPAFYAHGLLNMALALILTAIIVAKRGSGGTAVSLLVVGIPFLGGAMFLYGMEMGYRDGIRDLRNRRDRHGLPT